MNEFLGLLEIDASYYLVHYRDYHGNSNGFLQIKFLLSGVYWE
ncbi:hypothetical protein [Flavobacterium sp. XS2P39]